MRAHIFRHNEAGLTEMKAPESLIVILRDRAASADARDDAAMDLAAYDEPQVQEALVAVGSDPSTPGTIAASAGESLAEIWLRGDQFDPNAFVRLVGEARHEADALIRSRRRAWLESLTQAY